MDNNPPRRHLTKLEQKEWIVKIREGLNKELKKQNMKITLRQKRIERFNKKTGLGSLIVESALPKNKVEFRHLKSLLTARELYLKAYK